jgi:hypothetical protein
VNRYLTGKDSMGLRRDAGAAMTNDPLIVSVSFGATRKFVFKRTEAPNTVYTVQLEPGTVLVMSGAAIQAHYKQTLPKDKRCDAMRLNVTFRSHLSAQTVAECRRLAANLTTARQRKLNEKRRCSSPQHPPSALSSLCLFAQQLYLRAFFCRVCFACLGKLL